MESNFYLPSVLTVIKGYMNTKFNWPQKLVELIENSELKTELKGGVWRKRPETRLLPYLYIGETSWNQKNVSEAELCHLKQKLTIYEQEAEINWVKEWCTKLMHLLKVYLANSGFKAITNLPSYTLQPIDDGKIWAVSIVLEIKIAG